MAGRSPDFFVATAHFFIIIPPAVRSVLASRLFDFLDHPFDRLEAAHGLANGGAPARAVA